MSVGALGTALAAPVAGTTPAVINTAAAVTANRRRYVARLISSPSGSAAESCNAGRQQSLPARRIEAQNVTGVVGYIAKQQGHGQTRCAETRHRSRANVGDGRNGRGFVEKQAAGQHEGTVEPALLGER